MSSAIRSQILQKKSETLCQAFLNQCITFVGLGKNQPNKKQVNDMIIICAIVVISLNKI